MNVIMFPSSGSILYVTYFKVILYRVLYLAGLNNDCYSLAL